MAISDVTVRNAGPCAELTIRFPSHGGITLVTGHNGAGKDHVLNAVQSHIAGKGKVAVRDHQKRAEVDGFGAVMRIGGTTRRTGEVDVVSIEGRFDISVLHDPGIANSEAADARRIKELIKLAGVKPDHTQFHSIASSAEEFDRIVSPESLETDDLVTMAARIKRDFDAAALAAEREAKTHQANAKAARDAAADVDLTLPSDAAELEAKQKQAVREQTRLEAERDHRAEKLATAEASRRLLEEAKREYTGPTVAAAEKQIAEVAARLADKQSAVTSAVAAVKDAEAALQRAKDAEAYARESLKSVEREHEAAQSAKVTAEAHVRLVAQWQADVEAAANVIPISDDEINQAREAVDKATRAIADGVRVREAQADLARAAAEESKYKELTSLAERLRDAAKATDDVLSDAVQSDVLRVSGGRLVLDTERGRDTPFAELSEGQRWKVALDEAVKHVGLGGIIVLPQEAFDALDPDNQILIHQYASELGVHVLSGKRARGPLRVEQFDPATAS